MKIHRVLLPALLALAFALACAGQASAANCADCDDPGGGGGPPPGGQVSHAGPPETTISGWSGNNPMTADNTPSFAFSADEPALFSCRVDNGNWSSCGTPKTLGTLGDGQHTFFVKARDIDQNDDPTPAQRTFTVDTTSPDVTLTSGPANGGRVNDHTPTYGFSIQEANVETKKCKVDGGSWSSCSSPWTTPWLGEGTHTVYVQVKDGTDKYDTDSRSVVVDVTAPHAAIDSGPPIVTKATTPAFTFSAPHDGGGDYTFKCKIDNAVPVSCNGGQHSGSYTSPSSLTDGQHTFWVRATDSAGNFEASYTSMDFVVDTIDPAVAITSGPADGARSKDASPSYGFTATDATLWKVECRVDNGPLSACVSPYAPGPLSEGNHTITVRAYDGKNAQTAKTRAVTIDTTAPVTTIDGAQPLIADNTPTFGYSAPHDGGGAYTFRCSVDNAPAVPCDGGQSSGQFTTAQLSDGPHTFAVRGTDSAGNEAANSTQVAFVVDTVSPAAHIDAGPGEGATVAPGTQVFAFSAIGAAEFECSLDGAGWGACSSPLTTPGLAAGKHEFKVRALDGASNAGPPAVRTFTVAEPPAAPQQQPGSSQSQPQGGSTGLGGADGKAGAQGADGTTTVLTLAASQAVAAKKLPACKTVKKAKKKKRAKAKRGKRAHAAAVTCAAKKPSKKKPKHRKRPRRHR